MKTKVGLLGRNGFIGSQVLEVLRKSFDVVDELVPCEVLVNCAGFSRMYEAKQNPDKMRKVEEHIFDRVSRNVFGRLIHLSTIHISTHPQEPYSQIKSWQEDRILSRFPHATILRLSSVLGPGLQKNAVFDLLQGDDLWVTPDSLYTYISTEDVAGVIKGLVKNPRPGVINVGGSDSIRISEVARMMGKNSRYGTIHHAIPMDVSVLRSFYPVKTSREYVEEFWRSFHGR
jgi:dTDP-4-dehydrorhamnose reductase